MPDQLAYIKRFRMELHLSAQIREEQLPSGYEWVAWSDELLEHHAQVQYSSFHNSLDVEVFPNFATRRGCLYVMERIRHRDGFYPGSTWLISHSGRYVATVQAISERAGTGSIQNLGVVPEYRQQGLGRQLLARCLASFQQIGFRQIDLEVTAKNFPAIRLYRSFGFRCTRTIYKPIMLDKPAYAGSGI